MQHCDQSRQRWLSVHQWLQAIEPSSVSLSPHQHQYNRLKRKRADNDSSAAPPAMSTPPPSHSSSSGLARRGESPSKKRRLPNCAREQDRAFDDDDPFVSPAANDDLDADPTLRRTNNTGGIFVGNDTPFGLHGIKLSHPLQMPPAGSAACHPFATNTPSIASSATTTASTKSRARSTSPTKKTQTLEALRKPIHHVAIKDNATEQLPHDVRDLYNRLYSIIVEHEGVFPWEVRDEIIAAVGRPLKDFWFRKRRQDMPFDDDEAAAEQAIKQQQQCDRALAELRGMRKLERAAWNCRELGRSEAAWNLEVHGPLLELGLADHRHVTRELVTTAQVAKPFVPPMNDYSRNEFADRKMVDFVLVLEPDQDGSRKEVEAARDALEAERYRGLAQAIKKAVHSQWMDQQTINQTAYTPLWYTPIAVSIETKVDGMSEEGRTQLATWTAAWHERMRRFMDDTGEGGQDSRVITLPVLLIVEHSWVLSFVCDRGDKLEVVGDVPLGDTRTLTGLYTLVAVVQELGDWIAGPFCEWMEHVLARFY